MSAGFVDGPVRVRVPATSANLGPGFDAFGLALDLHDEVGAQVLASGLEVALASEGTLQAGPEVPLDETNLIVRAMRQTFARLDGDPPGLALHCRNLIPHGRGLGSSAAAIVAGVLLARGLVLDGRSRLTDGDVLRLAAEIEGHPDNVAPCLLGGLTLAWTADGGARAGRRDVDPVVSPVVLVPGFTASTEFARGLLPESVPHADAAFAAGRSALLMAALTGTPQALLDATEDRLHQRYREPAMPQTIALVDSLRRTGLPAVVSGAGPTVLVLARGEDEAQQALEAVPEGWAAHALDVDTVGAVLDGGIAPAVAGPGPNV